MEKPLKMCLPCSWQDVGVLLGGCSLCQIIQKRKGEIKMRKLLLAIGVSITLLVATTIQGSPVETFKKDGYTFEVHHQSQAFINSIGSVQCGGWSGNVEVEISDGFGMTIKEKDLEELLTAFGIDVGFGTDEVRVKAKMELRKKLVRETERFRDKRMLTRFTKKIPIKAMECYQQKAFIIYEKGKYKIRATKNRRVWPDKKLEFDWQENTDFQILIKAEYNEACYARCEIHGKKRPVKGEDGEQLWVRIPYRKKAIYMIPLYWGKDGKLIEPIQLLPEEVKKEFMAMCR